MAFAVPEESTVRRKAWCALRKANKGRPEKENVACIVGAEEAGTAGRTGRRSQPTARASPLAVAGE
jgi:hypothetical protein